MKITITPAKAISEAADGPPADRLLEHHSGEIERDQRGDEGQRDRLRQRHPPDAPEEQEAHDRDSTPRPMWMRMVARDGQPRRRGR